MQMKLIEPKKSKGETGYKTEVTVFKKEYGNFRAKLMLQCMDKDIDKPDSETSRTRHFIVDGDWLNKRDGIYVRK